MPGMRYGRGGGQAGEGLRVGAIRAGEGRLGTNPQVGHREQGEVGVELFDVATGERPAASDLLKHGHSSASNRDARAAPLERGMVTDLL